MRLFLSNSFENKLQFFTLRQKPCGFLQQMKNFICFELLYLVDFPVSAYAYFREINQ